MQAVVFHGPEAKNWDQVPDPQLERPDDIIVRVTTTTICGTDLHILKGDVPSVKPGTVLGHEAVGVVEAVGSAVAELAPGDRVLVPAITADGRCDYCRRALYSHCRHGGWILGNTINGTQAELVRVPYAETSVHKVPDALSDEQVLFLADILPTAFEIGVLNGQVRPGDVVAIVGAGPIGLAATMLAQLLSPRLLIVVDLLETRLELARQFGANVTVRSGTDEARQRVMELTGGDGADVVMEAVGVPATFELCQTLVRAGGRIANIGVYGGPVNLHLEHLWGHNITLTTGLVDTYSVPQLLSLVESGKLDPTRFVTHTFPLSAAMEAYDVFSRAGETGALKVVLKQ